MLTQIFQVLFNIKWCQNWNHA